MFCHIVSLFCTFQRWIENYKKKERRAKGEIPSTRIKVPKRKKRAYDLHRSRVMKGMHLVLSCSIIFSQEEYGNA